MASTTGISANTSSVATALSGENSKRLQEMATDDFIKILVSQLSSQDPFEPVKNQDLINQIGSIRQLEMNTTLNKTLTSMAETNSALGETMQSLLLKNNLSSASNLMGRFVEGQTPDGVRAAGRAVGVVVSGGEVLVQLDGGQRLGVDSVSRMLSPSDYVGRLVVGVGADGMAFSGEVTGVRAESGLITLDLDTGRKVTAAGAAVVIAAEDLQGRLVTGRNGYGTVVEGVVSEVQRTANGIRLELDNGEQIALESLTSLAGKVGADALTG